MWYIGGCVASKRMCDIKGLCGIHDFAACENCVP